MLRFNNLDGLTIGTKLIEVIGNTGSILPLNFYYPIFYKEKYFKSAGKSVHSPYITGFTSFNSWSQNYTILNGGLCLNYTIFKYRGNAIGGIGDAINRIVPMVDICFKIGIFYNTEHPNESKSENSPYPLGALIDSRFGSFFTLTLGASTGY